MDLLEVLWKDNGRPSLFRANLFFHLDVQAVREAGPYSSTKARSVCPNWEFDNDDEEWENHDVIGGCDGV
jgi:hypothetical protein